MNVFMQLRATNLATTKKTQLLKKDTRNKRKIEFYCGPNCSCFRFSHFDNTSGVR